MAIVAIIVDGRVDAVNTEAEVIGAVGIGRVCLGRPVVALSGHLQPQPSSR